MLLRCLHISLIACMMLSCNNTPVKTAAIKTDSVQIRIQDSLKRHAQYKIDSANQEKFHADLIGFYRGLINSSILTEDTSWRRNIDPDLTLDDYSISIPVYGDDPPTFTDFPLKDLHMSYHEGRDNYYFMINGKKFPETVYTGNNRFPANTIHRFTYKGGKYLVFGGGLRAYNGYGDRIHFNYFFDLTTSNITANMYENSWGWVDDVFLYGDLNNDGLLDRVVFDGVSRPSYTSKYDTITFTAETYKGRKWQPLKDSAKQPYVIKVQVEEESMEKIIAQHWPGPVPSLP